MEWNKRAFSLAPVEPAAIVASASDAVRERFEQSGCRFDVQVEPNLPSVTADADAMTTALVNLLDNAWKYTENDKQIALKLRREWPRLVRRLRQRHRPFGGMQKARVGSISWIANCRGAAAVAASA